MRGGVSGGATVELKMATHAGILNLIGFGFVFLVCCVVRNCGDVDLVRGSCFVLFDGDLFLLPCDAGL